MGLADKYGSTLSTAETAGTDGLIAADEVPGNPSIGVIGIAYFSLPAS